MSKKLHSYTDDFKKQIVQLINNGKRYRDVVSEYQVSRSTVNKWVNDYNKTKSFKAKDNRSETEIELLKLQKELAQSKMEIDILKQAALIMGRK